MSYVNLRQETPYCGDFSPRCEQPKATSDNAGWRAPNSVVARDFARNFDYFQSADSGFVTQKSLQNAANRPLTGNPFHDQMTFLAREILQRPELNAMLDGINHGGSSDGLISKGDVDRTVAHIDQQEAPPMREFPGRYSGAMQRQRLENQQPIMSAPHYANENQWDGSMSASGQRPYANDSKQDLLNKILARFSSFEDPNSPGLITDKSLTAVASGYHLDGRPATRAEMALANELLERGEVFKELDQSGTGVLDGAFSRDNLAYSSDKYRNMDNHDLIQGIKDNFRQFTAGTNDDYINVNELKEAAGVIPSNRMFSPEAQQLAAELLKRPGLLRELDIGTNSQGGVGYEDNRFDMANIDYILNNGHAPA
ncbi:hypothetical protein [Pseudomonas sp. 52 E 6]|uniref:hypothetical protein n=1 Tax=Pseudomonas sp. 52 E 6 TaxID=1844106 RepID=UPI0008125066|nr:hypothetical protein [Pseudomonas sp. 52 E 6]CRM74931.1 hypothetical protein [Pseudomonas sp. 52 E 6]